MSATPANQPSARRVRFTGQRDTRHYDMRSPPCVPHPVDTTRIKSNEARKHLNFIVSAKFANSRLQLERAGARVFSVQELENILAEEDVGVRTFAEPAKLERIPSMTREEMIEDLSVFFFREALESLEIPQLHKLMQATLFDDINEAMVLR